MTKNMKKKIRCVYKLSGANANILQSRVTWTWNDGDGLDVSPSVTWTARSVAQSADVRLTLIHRLVWVSPSLHLDKVTSRRGALRI